MSDLFTHQKKVFEELHSTARVLFSRTWRRLPITPRFTRLVVGPTGCGKTHLVRRLAAQLGIPMLEISASNWIPLGCANRGGRPTWPELAQFCFDNKRGVIFVDELDKLSARTSDWQTYLRVEIFSLLDQRILSNVHPPDSLVENRKSLRLAAARLRSSFLVVGAGAFQDLWEAREATSIGFQNNHTANATFIPGQRQLGTVIPREIVNRFASPVLVLQPLREGDYRRMLADILQQIPSEFRNPVRHLGEDGIESAVLNHLGCRWIEEILLHALILAYPEGEPKRPSSGSGLYPEGEDDKLTM